MLVSAADNRGTRELMNITHPRPSDLGLDVYWPEQVERFSCPIPGNKFVIQSRQLFQPLSYEMNDDSIFDICDRVGFVVIRLNRIGR